MGEREGSTKGRKKGTCVGFRPWTDAKRKRTPQGRLPTPPRRSRGGHGTRFRPSRRRRTDLVAYPREGVGREGNEPPTWTSYPYATLSYDRRGVSPHPGHVSSPSSAGHGMPDPPIHLRFDRDGSLPSEPEASPMDGSSIAWTRPSRTFVPFRSKIIRDLPSLLSPESLPFRSRDVPGFRPFLIHTWIVLGSTSG